MPHRIPHITSAGLWMIDGICLGFAALAATLSQIDVKSFTGPDGFLLAALAVVAVLWKNGVSRDKLLAKNHDEMLAMQREANKQIAELTAEGIKASFMVAGEIKDLRSELEKRVCWAKLPEKK